MQDEAKLGPQKRSQAYDENEAAFPGDQKRSEACFGWLTMLCSALNDRELNGDCVLSSFVAGM